MADPNRLLHCVERCVVVLLTANAVILVVAFGVLLYRGIRDMHQPLEAAALTSELHNLQRGGDR